MMQRQEPIQEMEDPVYATLNQFFRHYLIERDAEKALAMLSDQVYSIGAGEDEIAIGKQAFRTLLQSELRSLPEPITFRITQFNQRQRMPGCWHCYCQVELGLPSPGGPPAPWGIRLTAGLHQEGGRYIIDVIHASEAGLHLAEGFIPPGGRRGSGCAGQVPLELVSQMMPGGIIGCYIQAGYPLYLANQRLLDMAGYPSYEAFYEDIQSLAINGIHPDDREFVTKEVSNALESGAQYEIEYRMKRGDGSYFWVHDIGRKMVAGDGRAAVMCALIDISQQVDIQKSLQNELLKDPLTGVYNRKGGYDRMEQAMGRCSCYLFLMVDMDNFKLVNDLYGHEQGDQALCYIASKLVGSFRESDTVFRLGGDEFAVFVPSCPDGPAMEAKLRGIAQDYREMMQAHWPLAHSTLSVGGVYGRKPHTFNELYQMADEMLYQVKKGAKGQINIRTLPEV